MKTPHNKNEQKLVDITFEIAQAIHTNHEWFRNKTQEELCTWVAKQLCDCGFDTEPVGASWGILK